MKHSSRGSAYLSPAFLRNNDGYHDIQCTSQPGQIREFSAWQQEGQLAAEVLAGKQRTHLVTSGRELNRRIKNEAFSPSYAEIWVNYHDPLSQRFHARISDAKHGSARSSVEHLYRRLHPVTNWSSPPSSVAGRYMYGA